MCQKPQEPAKLAFLAMTAKNTETVCLSMDKAEARKVYRVAGIDEQSTDANRLKALGFCEGREVEVLRKGRSWVVRVLGSRVGLSSQLACAVQLIPAA